MSMDTNIHAYGKYACTMDIWEHECIDLDSSKALIHMHKCNMLGWHMSKLSYVLRPCKLIRQLNQMSCGWGVVWPWEYQ